MKNNVKLLAIILSFTLGVNALTMSSVNTVYARPDEELTDILEYARITKAAGPTYSADLQMWLENGRLGYYEFNLSSIPDSVSINRVSFRYFGGNTASASANVSFRKMTVQPSQLADNNETNSQIYTDVLTHSIYAELAFPDVADQWRTTVLTGAAGDISLASDYFAVGLNASVSVGYHKALTPVLILSTYQSGDFMVTSHGLYYENGTIAGAMNITAALPTGSELIELNGTEIDYYPTLPTEYVYSLGGGGSRIISILGNETLYITTPEDTYSTYSITIKDYIGLLGDTAYLEAQRVINGTYRVIERRPINSPNAVPLLLVTEQVYRLVIRYGGNQTYTWGLFTAGDDTTFTLAVNVVEFSDQAQSLGNYITLEATRTDSTITATYQDSRDSTNNVTVTIKIYGGAVVNEQWSSNQTSQWNYAGSATTSYEVVFNGDHSEHGVWAWSYMLDADNPSLPDAPDLSTILNVPQDLIGLVITYVGLFTFSVQDRKIGVGATMGIASILRVIGLLSYSYNYIMFGWVIVVIIFLQGDN